LLASPDRFLYNFLKFVWEDISPASWPINKSYFLHSQPLKESTYFLNYFLHISDIFRSDHSPIIFITEFEKKCVCKLCKQMWHSSSRCHSLSAENLESTRQVMKNIHLYKFETK
jgi:hypothetical protein